MISAQLRNEYNDVGEVLSENLDKIRDLYEQCLAASFGHKIEPEESHDVFCTLIAICLVYDIDEVKFPLSYETEDEELIAKVMHNIDILLTVEAMADKNIVKRKVIDGKIHYTAE